MVNNIEWESEIQNRVSVSSWEKYILQRVREGHFLGSELRTFSTSFSLIVGITFVLL